MVNRYKMGNLTLKCRLEDRERWEDENLNVFFYSEQALIDAGGVAVEELINYMCEKNKHDQCRWCECDCHKTKPYPSWEDLKLEAKVAKKMIKAIEKELEPQPDECQQTTQNRVDKIKLPSATIKSSAVRGWMKAVTNMLNRHEQLLREEA
jgi:hypothetical protein